MSRAHVLFPGIFGSALAILVAIDVPHIVAQNTPPTATATSLSAAPVPLVIGDSVSCERCSIALETFAQIGASGDSVLLTQNTRFVVTGDGRIFASPTATPGVIAVYNNRGVFTGTIGREGGGPGEFNRVWGAIYKNERLYVIDRGHQRINVFGPGLAFERGIPLTENFADNDGLLLVGSRLIVSSIFQTPATPGPVVILDLMGRRLRTLSPEPDSVPMSARRRYLSESTGDKFWVAPFNRYAMELWDTAGRQHRIITRNAHWFQPWSVPTSVTTMLPQPQLKSVREDSAGRLWITALVPDQRWQPQPNTPAPLLDSNSLLDTRIEVLDIRTGRLIVTYLTDKAIGKVTAPGVMFSAYRTDANGFVIWTLYRARVQGLREPLLQ